MKIIILLQADGELTGDCAVLGTACSSPGQEAKAFIFLGGRGCRGASPPGQGKVKAQSVHAFLSFHHKKKDDTRERELAHAQHRLPCPSNDRLQAGGWAGLQGDLGCHRGTKGQFSPHPGRKSPKDTISG